MIEFKTMVEYEFGFFTNPFVPRVVAEEDTGILWLRPAGAGFVDSIPPTHSRWQRFPKRLIVRGGDGSVREICQWMHDRGEFRPIGLLPGGTQNLFFKALSELGFRSDVKTFLKKEMGDYPEDRRLRPGMINDRVFVNHVGLGRLEQYLGEWNKRLRCLPIDKRTLAATFISLALAASDPNRKGDIFNLYTIIPRINRVPAFPYQNLLGDTITHAKVANIRDLVQTLFYWHKGEPAPNGVMVQDRGSQFSDEVRGNSIWLDGDTVSYMSQEVTIRRAPYGIPIVAIVH